MLIPNKKMVLIQQLHLPHSQPSELVKMSEENEYRLRRPGIRRLGHCAPIQVHEEAMFEWVYCKIVVRMLVYTGLMCTARRMICWWYCVEVIVIAESTDHIFTTKLLTIVASVFYYNPPYGTETVQVTPLVRTLASSPLSKCVSCCQQTRPCGQ